jgi:hypothetical protein
MDSRTSKEWVQQVAPLIVAIAEWERVNGAIAAGLVNDAERRGVAKLVERWAALYPRSARRLAECIPADEPCAINIESHSGRSWPGEKSACIPADDRGIADARSSEGGMAGRIPAQSIQSCEPVGSNSASGKAGEHGALDTRSALTPPHSLPAQPPEVLTKAPAPMPRPDEYVLRINGWQINKLATFAEDADTSMVLRYYGEDRKDGDEPMPAGLYAWYEEYPEEGQLLLVPAPTKCAGHE